METASSPAESAGEQRIRVLIADDHAAIRAGLWMMLSGVEDIEVVGEAADGTVAVRQASALTPDVVLMDIRMPGMDGIEATREIIGRELAAVLVLTTFDIDRYVLAALRAGASGFLLKTASARQVLAALRAVAAGDGVLAPEVTRTIIDAVAAGGTGLEQPRPEGLQDLTDREREVLVCLGEGLSNSDIAHRLTISGTTVKTHVSRILGKLGLRSRVQAALAAQSLSAGG